MFLISPGGTAAPPELSSWNTHLVVSPFPLKTFILRPIETKQHNTTSSSSYNQDLPCVSFRITSSLPVYWCHVGSAPLLLPGSSLGLVCPSSLPASIESFSHGRRPAQGHRVPTTLPGPVFVRPRWHLGTRSISTLVGPTLSCWALGLGTGLVTVPRPSVPLRPCSNSEAASSALSWIVLTLVKKNVCYSRLLWNSFFFFFLWLG